VIRLFLKLYGVLIATLAVSFIVQMHLMDYIWRHTSQGFDFRARFQPTFHLIEETLAPLPAGVTLRRGNRGRREMTIWFATSRGALERRFDQVARAVGEGTLWMAWPKGSSGVETGLDENAIRDLALSRGMVDSKVCAIDETWSGLRLVIRIEHR